MARVILSITTTPKKAAPGSTSGGYRWSLSDGVNVDTAEPTVTFDSVGPGEYVAAVRRLNADGSPVEPQADFVYSQAFSVAAPPPPPPADVMLDAPVGMTITIDLSAASAAVVAV